uniref:Uncharacterized protein n=1 Tax=Parascaris equorum TaxID=6256 RepID=A0A914RJK5_PAREQ
MQKKIDHLRSLDLHHIFRIEYVHSTSAFLHEFQGAYDVWMRRSRF